MNKRLTKTEIKTLIKQERAGSQDYKDQADIVLDKILALYEGKEINEATLKILASLVVSSMTKQTTHEMDREIKNKILFRNSSEHVNKLFLLNYSKKSYA